ncbi:MAG TPA: glycoside hydrolase family 9 protein [Trebonia sp.]
MMRRAGITLAALTTLTTLAVPAASSALASSQPASAKSASAKPTTAKPAAPEIRLNQVGYQPTAPKSAYVMLPARVASVPFTITDAKGRVVYRGVSRDDVGAWNAGYQAVYLLSFSGLHRCGTYQVRVGSTVSVTFKIANGSALYGPLVDNAVRYFTSERDGADVEHDVLSREPANLTDEKADVYATPSYDDNDNLLGTLKKVGGPVNVSGGWFDAGGGYEKFGYTASYADALMLIAARGNAGQSSTLKPEAEYGLQWITKLWNPSLKVLYMQVGIGNGNASNTIQGDYNFWFLPQQEDMLDVAKGGNPGPTAFYVKYRPVFEAAAPGQKVSPDLAGRYAADFALGAQLARGSNARHDLSLARSVYADAKTTDVGQLVTAYPNDYYPGTEWKSDMLWGATEIALADERLGVPRAQLRADLAVAARWARAYIVQGHPAGSDTLNLYDTGAIAESELLQAMRASRMAPAIAPRLLVNDLAAQLQVGETWAKGDPFALGTDLGSADAAPHAFGLYVTNELYRQAGGSARYQAFAQQQLNFALGANAWGSSFVVGAGTTYPHCMQSEIANLAGSLTGHGDIQLGAVTDGPSSPGNFVGLGTVSGMRACSAGSFSAFNNSSAAYEDNVVSWPSVEPADDYTAISLFAFSMGASSGRD